MCRFHIYQRNACLDATYNNIRVLPIVIYEYCGLEYTSNAHWNTRVMRIIT